MKSDTETIVEQRRQRIEGVLAEAQKRLLPLSENSLQLARLPAAEESLPPRREEDTGRSSGPTEGGPGPSLNLRPNTYATNVFSDMDIETLQRGYQRREFSVTEVVTSMLSDIASLNPQLRAFSEVFDEEALRQAAILDGQLASGAVPAGLFGIPVGIKDIIDIAGYRTTAGCQMYADNDVAQEDARVVRKLRDSQAIIIGKNATHELAFGCTSDSAFHGPVRNPHDLSRVSGGSSGGSASAVAAGLIPVSIGTDTGGSVRIPSALCGIFGLKATRDQVSTAGVWPLGFSLDHVGPLCRSIDDLVAVYAAIRETAGAQWLVRDGAAGLNGIKVGLPVSWLERQRIHDSVWNAFETALRKLETAGAHIVELEPQALPDLYELVALNRLLIMAEGASQYAYLLSKPDLVMTPEIEMRLHIGNSISAPAYINAQRLRKELTCHFDTAMARIDVMIMPTIPVVAPCIGDLDVALSESLREDVREALVRFTTPNSITGHPALSVPAGMDHAKLPVAVQLVGRYHGEALLFRAARCLS